MTVKTYGTDSRLRQQRAKLHAYWRAHPEATGEAVAVALGVSPYTALANRPHGLPRTERDIKRLRPMPANAEAPRLYDLDYPLAELAERTGRSITTTRRYLRSVIKARGTPPA